MTESVLQAPEPSRRSFLRNGVAVVSAMAASVAALSPLRDLDPDDIPSLEQILQKHYKEMSPERDGARRSSASRDDVKKRNYGIRRGSGRDVRPTAGVEFVYALNLTPVQRQPASCVHACVAKRTTQSRDARDAVHPRASKCRSARSELAPGEPPLRSRDVVPDRRPLLHAGPVPPVRQPALRQGLPRRGNLAGAGRHHGHRLRLVHRLPLLRGGLPVLGASLQLRGARGPEGVELNPHMSYLSNRPRHARASWRSARSACTGRARAGCPPASRCARSARASSATSSTPTARSRRSSATSASSSSRRRVGTLPRFFYYFDERYRTARRGDRRSEPVAGTCGARARPGATA